MKKVCLVIVTHNRLDCLQKAVMAARHETEADILVVDNASTDGTQEWLQRESQINIFELSTNTGGAGGFAAGMRWAYEGKWTETTPVGHIGSVKLVAHYEEPCIVKFETFGGQITPPMQAHNGTIQNVPEGKKYGFQFEGWYWDRNFLFPFTNRQVINESCTLFGKFSEIEYTITYDSQGGISARSNPTSYRFEDPTILIKPASKKGYVFDGWYDQIGRKREFIRHHSLGNLQLVAKYHKEETE